MFELLDLILDWIASALLGARGPLVVVVERRDAAHVLTLENQGRRKLQFAAVRARDEAGRTYFPSVDLAPRSVLPASERRTATLDLSGRRVDGRTHLEVLDTSGTAWPVRWEDR
jgi:hypothetical protein